MEGGDTVTIVRAKCAAPDGSEFTGRLYNGKYMGSVVWSTGEEKGQVFQGQVNINGEPVEGGITMPKTGITYTGTFNWRYTGTFNGRNLEEKDVGVMKWPNGDVFEGEFYSFVPSNGVMSYAPRKVQFVNGKDTGAQGPLPFDFPPFYGEKKDF